MKDYYLNKKTNTNPGNNNEIHAEGCYRMPNEDDRFILCSFKNFIQTKSKAKGMG